MIDGQAGLQRCLDPGMLMVDLLGQFGERNTCRYNISRVFERQAEGGRRPRARVTGVS